MVAKKRTPIPEEAAPQKSIDDLFGDDDEVEASDVNDDANDDGKEDILETNDSLIEKESSSAGEKPKKTTSKTKADKKEGLLGAGIPNKAKIAEIKSEVSDRLAMLEKTGSMDMYLGASLDFIDDDGTQGIQLGNYSAGVLSRMKVMLQEARVLKKHKLSVNAINGAMIQYVLDEIRTKKGKSKFLNDFVLNQKLDSLNVER